ncbi:MAG: hypothetical protein E5V64_06520 [Mesorhizobium sp.]|uniref:hypothetical protein n=1 Tax=Mesorhizobium sp. TaxID=1871066 RepID=UPI001229809B|nr:hypothetical protein [Mesorhizobium sp.]TIV83814.1 MAG: hypothetical protein E5V64_06520 [Mesorhizobium sp.]
MSEWETKWQMPDCGHDVHVGIWQPSDDVGGARYVVTVTLTDDDEFRDGWSPDMVREKSSRLVVFGLTHEQIEEAAATVARLLPDYKRVTVERAEAAKWAII